MADYASNTPISGPRKMPWDVMWDCNGLVWNNDYGFFFQVSDDSTSTPIQRPARILGRTANALRNPFVRRSE